MDLNFRMVHQNFNVADLDTSLDFYEKALGLKEKAELTVTVLLSFMLAMIQLTLCLN